jgi:hypothetical protein
MAPKFPELTSYIAKLHKRNFPYPYLVVFVVEGNVLGQLHDPFDGVDLVLHHDLHLGRHPSHHVEPVHFLNL